jgi:DNA-binding CsgD family transcriptional regulator
MERANEAFERGDLETARAGFEEALREGESAEAYEGLSWVAWSLNEAELVFRAREEAFRLYRQAGDNLGAARMAMWLGGDYVDFRGELSIASGWRQRARRLLEGEPTAPEHGWLALIEGDFALCIEENAPIARELGRQAVRIGRELRDADIEIIGLAMDGLASVTEGDVEAGFKLLDEAAAAAVSGEMSHPGYIGWALCYSIYACERLRDYDRALEWCKKLREYAERSQMAVTRGICRVHYAGVLIWRGDWHEAEEELSGAFKDLKPDRPLLAADGTVRLAELRMRQGRFEESEAMFRQVEWHPLALLGLAELALESGRPRDAEELVERYLRQVPEGSRTQRADALEVLARAAALLGNRQRAAQTLETVRHISELIATPPLKAATNFSAGTFAVTERDYEAARASFEDAAGLYDRCGAPYEAARARLELASVLVMLDRLERAQVEAEAAQRTLAGLGSGFYAGRAAALLEDIARRQDEGAGQGEGPLTERQIEILRLISRGLNDREIAASLVVSEHTVHRHVANILQRLDLPSRSAAVAYASSQGML